MAKRSTIDKNNQPKTPRAAGNIISPARRPPAAKANGRAATPRLRGLLRKTEAQYRRLWARSRKQSERSSKRYGKQTQEIESEAGKLTPFALLHHPSGAIEMPSGKIWEGGPLSAKELRWERTQFILHRGGKKGLPQGDWRQMTEEEWEEISARVRANGAAKTPKAQTTTNVMPNKGADVRARASFFETYLTERAVLGFADAPAFARARGVHFAVASEMKRGKYSPAQPAIVFTNLDPFSGAKLSSPARLEEPVVGKDGKKKKFINPTGLSAEPYLTDCGRPWEDIANDTKTPIVISEGPTRALAGAQIGLPVITLPGVNSGFEPGTERTKLRPVFYRIKKWKRRKVYLSFDSDSPGNSSMRMELDKLAAALTGMGAVVSIVPAARVTKDGKSGIDDEFHLCGHQGYLARCAAAPPWSESQHTNGITPLMLRGDEIEDKEIEYLLDKRIPLGMLTGLCGHPGDGKSFLCERIGADGSRGHDTFTSKRIPKFNTVYWTLESPPETVQRRWRHMGGDLKRLHVLLGGENEDKKRVALTLADIPILTEAIRRAKAKQLVIDPFQSFLGAKVDMHRANETRPLLDGLSSMSKELNCAVIVVRHLPKVNTGRAVTGGLGSVDITAAMRTEYMVGSAPEDPRHTALVHTKPGELPRAESLRYEIVEDKESKKVQLMWRGKSQLTGSDITAPESTRRITKKGQARQFLWEALAKGPRSLADLMRECGGIYDLQTLQRAASDIGIVMRGSKSGGADARIWELPDVSRFAKYIKKEEEEPE